VTSLTGSSKSAFGRAFANLILMQVILTTNNLKSLSKNMFIALIHHSLKKSQNQEKKKPLDFIESETNKLKLL